MKTQLTEKILIDIGFAKTEKCNCGIKHGEDTFSVARDVYGKWNFVIISKNNIFKEIPCHSTEFVQDLKNAFYLAFGVELNTMKIKRQKAVICKNLDDFVNYMLKEYNIETDCFHAISNGIEYKGICDKRQVGDNHFDSMELSYLAGEKESLEEIKLAVSDKLRI